MPYTADLHYFEHGKEWGGHLPLVLIHGAGGSHLSWPPQIRRLPGRRILAPDLPGHGRSQGLCERTIEGYSNIVLAFLDALDVETTIIAGHSMGGAIALWLALQHSERVAGLILIGTGARLRVNSVILEKAASETAFREAVSLVTAHSFSPGTGFDPAGARLVELVEQRMAETRQDVLYDDFLACDRFDVMERVSEILQPALILVGEEDQMTPPRYARYLEERLPNARLEILPGAGHMAMLEKPEMVCELMERFLSQPVQNNN